MFQELSVDKKDVGPRERGRDADLGILRRRLEHDDAYGGLFSPCRELARAGLPRNAHPRRHVDDRRAGLLPEVARGRRNHLLGRASLEYIVPADPTLWATAAAFAPERGDPRAADPLICAYDVRRTGGPDADDAVAQLVAAVEREWAAA